MSATQNSTPSNPGGSVLAHGDRGQHRGHDNTHCTRVRRMVAAFLLATAAPAVPALGSGTLIEQPVKRGERLELRNYLGSVSIEAADTDQLRIEADHPAGEEIVAEKLGVSWLVVPRSWRRDSSAFDVQLPNVGRVVVRGEAPPRVDFKITLPDWMPVIVETPRGDVEVSGTLAPVDVMGMLGDIEVRGGRERLHLRTMNGRVDLSDASGRVTIETTRRPVSLTGCAGDLQVDTTAGDVTLKDIEPDSLNVRSVDGDIVYQGRLGPAGRYEMVTHSGDVRLELDEPVDAHFRMRAFRGQLDYRLDPPLPDGITSADFTHGEGGPRLILQSFTGRIIVNRRRLSGEK